MYHRLLFYALFLILISAPAAGISLYSFPNAALEQAAANLKEKKYDAAREAALSAPQGGGRDFLAGMIAVKLQKWDEAADLLGRAATGFPLLGDFALYNQAQSLYRLSRFTDAVKPLLSLQKQYPDSPLARQAQLLLADALYSARDFGSALEAYQKFIEKYPFGNDSVTALYKSAQCREELGDLNGAVAVLRNIWLGNPASAFADKAEADISRLAAKGAAPVSYTAEQLYKRGLTLYDLRKYDQAIKTFTTIPSAAQSPDLTCRLALKTGQAQYKARRCKDAEKTLSGIDTKGARKGLDGEILFWLARSLDRNGKYDEAVATYLKLAQNYPKHELADNALLEASMVRRSQKRGSESVALLSRLLDRYPGSDLKENALWQIAWDSYLSRNYGIAAERFKALAATSYREKALYWYYRSAAATGDTTAAAEAVSTLLKEFPVGFYATYYRSVAKVDGPEQVPVLPRQASRSQAPPGFERAKALIAFGLYDEAKKELALFRKKAKNGMIPGLAELYLQMNDYNGAFALFAKTPPWKAAGKDNTQAWSFFYPLAFNTHVAVNASKTGLPESLIYSIMRAESNYSTTALSPVGAVGLMQLMPATASAIYKREKLSTEKLTQPELNIALGARHLKDLLAVYQDDTICAVAAYNAGSGNVNRWRKAFPGLEQDEFIENIPFGETREYVKKVLTAAAIYQRLYNFSSRTVTKPADVGQDDGQTAMPDSLPVAGSTS